MTVSIKDVRIRISPKMVDSYVAKRGIDSIFKPLGNQKEKDVYDVRFLTSDKNPVMSERCTMSDIEQELEKFNVIKESKLDNSPLYVKTFDKQKVGMAFESREDNKALDSIDDVRSNAKNMSVEADVPRGEHQIRWYDKSW